MSNFCQSYKSLKSIHRKEDGDQNKEYCFSPVLQGAATIEEECEALVPESRGACPFEDAFSDQISDVFDETFNDTFCSDSEKLLQNDEDINEDPFMDDSFYDVFEDNLFNDSPLSYFAKDNLRNANFEEGFSDALGKSFDQTFGDTMSHQVKRNEEQIWKLDEPVFNQVLDDNIFNDLSLF